MTEDVVPDLSFDRTRIGAPAGRITEAMLPAQERQAQTSGTGLPSFLVDVPLFPTELPEVRIETEPPPRKELSS